MASCGFVSTEFTEFRYNAVEGQATTANWTGAGSMRGLKRVWVAALTSCRSGRCGSAATATLKPLCYPGSA